MYAIIFTLSISPQPTDRQTDNIKYVTLDQKNLNIEKIIFKVVQMKFLAMHTTNKN